MQEGTFALDVALTTLSFFSDYFGTPYALPKCDLVAIPDFAAGAMENWGLITFRETAMLVSEVRDTLRHAGITLSPPMSHVF